MKAYLLILFLFFFPILGYAQVDSVAVQSIEGITDKMLEMISGDIGEDRNWEEYRNLFLPTAQKIAINKDAKQRQQQVQVMNLEEFVRYIGPLYKRDGFEEVALGLEIQEYNGMATVFQSFHCKNLRGTYEQRGVNSYQLVYQDDRWWIANVMFTNETKKAPLPNKYLFPENQRPKAELKNKLRPQTKER